LPRFFPLLIMFAALPQRAHSSSVYFGTARHLASYLLGSTIHAVTSALRSHISPFHLDILTHLPAVGRRNVTRYLPHLIGLYAGKAFHVAPFTFS
jgi:hypothetical protein